MHSSWQGPSRCESTLCIVLSLLFVVIQAAVVGLRPEHVVLVVLFDGLFFLSRATRQLAVALLPFALFGITYDWMRICPNYTVNPIDIRPLYEAEQQLFGISISGTTLIPGEYFNLHHWPLADLLAGVCYLCWVPVPIAFGLWLYGKRHRRAYLHFALAFLFVNWLGFVCYYIHPAAPPWYAINYGFEPDLTTPASVAGLIRFDELIGYPLFQNIYGRNANIFAAVPSLHAAYMFIAFIYALLSRSSRWWQGALLILSIGIWLTAVYSCHHYIIDVLLGILCALVGIALFEQLLMRLPAFSRFVDRYAHYIS